MKGNKVLLIDCPETYGEKPEVKTEVAEELVEVYLGPTEKKVTRVGCTLNSQQKHDLTELLVSQRSNFAFHPENMPGINPEIASYRLNVDPSFPLVRQKKRSIRGDRQKAISEEVDKLILTGFIREVTYPKWLANDVMVKKANNKERMCVDFKDLNKACSKDSYPLPKIDKLVDSTAGYEFFSLLDAYSRYHQIPCIQLMKRKHPS